MNASFEIQSLKVEMRGKTLLEVDSLLFPHNKNTAIIGPNGAGKSTLLKALIGQTGSGTVNLFGQYAAPQIKQGRVAWVGQHGRYAMPMTVREYIALSGFSQTGRLKRAATQTDELLAYFDLTDLADKRISRLSGGEQQRANIIRALLQNAPVLLLDEPCNHLDIRHQHKLMQYLRDQQNTSGSIMVLHDLNLAAHYAQHIVLMNQGKIIATGAPQDVMREDLLQQVYHWPIRCIRDETGLYFHA
ncbi:ABC transporter ATP-binding protein [Neisseria yangbaofengii]|uniref:ABC transporter ATP-binding protein n=1 Tax=Neisseria yangbaofengii TaxID=2709396 RepID=UPI0013EE2D26|nr:ABC transporter ATP-binding protein [Neisseria yangbaofengii]